MIPEWKMIKILQKSHDEMERDEHGFGKGDTPDYIPGYMQAIIDVARECGLAFYNEGGKDVCQIRKDLQLIDKRQCQQCGSEQAQELFGKCHQHR